MTERKVPKKTSLLIVGILLLGTAGLATAAAADAGEDLLPMLQGKPIAYERGLSRNTVALAVYVAEFDGETRGPVEGATVTVYPFMLRNDGPKDPDARTGPPTATPIASQETDSEGRTVFELRPERYVVQVDHGNATGHHMTFVPRDTRLYALFDEEGQVRFHEEGRRDIARHGEPDPLVVRVGEFTENGRAPIEGATVTILQPARDDEGAFEEVAQKETDERGGAGFQLPRGRYIVHVETPDGDTGEHGLLLQDPSGLFVIFDEEGDAHFREMHRGEPPRPDRASIRDGGRERPERPGGPKWP